MTIIPKYRRFAFLRNAYGKPYLDGNKKVHINWTHAGSWVAVILGESAVGIDIELVASVKMEIARRFFATEEYQTEV